MDVEVTLEDFQNAFRLLHGTSKEFGRVPRVMLWLLFAAVVIGGYCSDFWSDPFLMGFVFLIIALVPLMSRGVRLQREKSYSQAKRQFSGMKYEWDEKGLSVLGGDPIFWSEFVKTKEDDRVFIAFHTDQTFLIFPKRDIGQLHLIDNIKMHIAKAELS